MGRQNVPATKQTGKEEYTVKEGDCILSIATEHGLFWETVWNDPKNKELKDLRKDPNVLMPGDKVYVPELRPQEISVGTDVKHGFRRKGTPGMLRLQLKDDDEPRENAAYTLVIDGIIIEGNTDSDGYIKQRIPGNAKRAKLLLNDGGEEYEIRLGGIDPIDSASGVQERLRNLGFDCPSTGIFDAGTTMAIRKFQRARKLKEDGTMDDDTKAALLNAHGS